MIVAADLPNLNALFAVVRGLNAVSSGPASYTLTEDTSAPLYTVQITSGLGQFLGSGSTVQAAVVAIAAAVDTALAAAQTTASVTSTNYAAGQEALEGIS